ncbi:MAG: D-alanyl-D-alanine carboxypeptidase [Clostridia bacterium]|nr:D-alanyl-D-alanine carboxypeptidase [Clostridia bacterium]
MKHTRTKAAILLLAVFLLLQCTFFASSAEEALEPIHVESETQASDLGVAEGALNLNCQSAILMEATTGTVLYLQNANEALPPASVTKIMTLLLLMEAIDAGTIHLDDTVTVSANAASMGGSQVYLKEGEQMVLEDLLKSVVIASANDAAVALAEYLCGSVNAFVEKMNAKAAQLGMENTVFENVTGLDDTAENHLTSARDIAIMSKELISHPKILEYSSIWMDTIRDGAFGLTNTNRLVRFYRGCTGLKTGSTSKAGFCVSVTAERDGFSLICVIMGAESRDVRNAAASELLDWGFANYGLYTSEAGVADPIPVVGGVKDTCELSFGSYSQVLAKNVISDVKTEITLPESIEAPIKAGDTVGSVTFVSDGKVIGSIPIVASETVEKINFFEIFQRMLAKFLLI